MNSFSLLILISFNFFFSLFLLSLNFLFLPESVGIIKQMVLDQFGHPFGCLYAQISILMFCFELSGSYWL